MASPLPLNPPHYPYLSLPLPFHPTLPLAAHLSSPAPLLTINLPLHPLFHPLEQHPSSPALPLIIDPPLQPSPSDIFLVAALTQDKAIANKIQRTFKVLFEIFV